MKKTQLLSQISELIESHLEKWPLSESALSCAEIICKASAHPTIRNWDPLRWENCSDLFIEQFRFQNQLLALIPLIKRALAEEGLPVS